MTSLYWIGVVVAALGFVVFVEWQNHRRLRNYLRSRPSLTPREFGETYFEGERREIAEFVRESLEQWGGANFSGVHPSDRFREDLRLDELDELAPVQILEDAEERYGIRISDEEAVSTRTVGDFVNLIAEKSKDRPRPN